jgi:cell division septum initiation protein DivIVA
MPRRGKTGAIAMDTPLLEAALIGFEQLKRNVEDKIRDLRSRLGSGESTAATSAKGGRRTLSAAARNRIAAAQRKRWAAVKAKGAPAKRVLSAAARKKIAVAQKKRWAALKASKAATPAAPKKASAAS